MLLLKILRSFVVEPFLHNVVFIAESKVVECINKSPAALGFCGNEKISRVILSKQNFSLYNFIDMPFRVFHNDQPLSSRTEFSGRLFGRISDLLFGIECMLQILLKSFIPQTVLWPQDMLYQKYYVFQILLSFLQMSNRLYKCRRLVKFSSAKDFLH